ncbi:cytochrome c biogenesis protein CcsA [bacterium]|nr:cytochrome c biogenesis protein CcsA [Mariniblastus sp.]MDB2317951.1 cytochrome c biogenesis protein CcsA [bacterium]MDB4370498.1 cytochrome c biogenesis protein CcsA [Mariniblastus sp.]
MNWLQNISITCFAASYAVVFFLEISRVFFDVSFRKYVRVGFAAAGLFAHTVFLILQGKLVLGSTGLWLGSWFGWCLATAWILALAYIWISARQPKSVIGLFLVPLILGLIGLGVGFGHENQFSPMRAKSIWNMVHGSALLLGTAIVALGFVFGVVYVVQSRRLKHKSPQSRHFRLPSLEWLQKSSEYSLIISTFLLAIGLVSGIAINWTNPADDTLSSGRIIAWSNPVIWSSGILFSWLLIVSVFNFCYQPSRQGRKVAYLVIASFLFLVLELAIVWWVGHATSDSNPDVAQRIEIQSVSEELHSVAGRLKI